MKMSFQYFILKSTDESKVFTSTNYKYQYYASMTSCNRVLNTTIGSELHIKNSYHIVMDKHVLTYTIKVSQISLSSIKELEENKIL